MRFEYIVSTVKRARVASSGTSSLRTKELDRELELMNETTDRLAPPPKPKRTKS